jgi:nitrate reductase NapAB chaperone NapD
VDNSLFTQTLQKKQEANLIYSGTVIVIFPEKYNETIRYLKQFKEIEVFTSSDDKKQIVTAIETKNHKTLEILCEKIKESDLIVDVSHHYFYFEDEVKRMVEEGNLQETEQMLKEK